MKVIGCDFHTRYQRIAMLNQATGELTERRLEHENGEVHAFYRSLSGAVRIGIEATDHQDKALKNVAKGIKQVLTHKEARD